jgi:hypothetical protein
VLGSHDTARRVDLVRDLEPVDVVVHRVEQGESAVAALEPGDLAALEDAALARARTVEVGVHRRGDRAGAEQRAAGVAVREARVGQVDPSRCVEAPAFERIDCRALGLLARKLRDLPREPRRLDHRVDGGRRARALPHRVPRVARQAGDHGHAGERPQPVGDRRRHLATQRPPMRRANRVLRRRRGHDLDLEGAVGLLESHRVRERIVVRVVDAAGGDALVAVAAAQ